MHHGYSRVPTASSQVQGLTHAHGWDAHLLHSSSTSLASTQRSALRRAPSPPFSSQRTSHSRARTDTDSARSQPKAHRAPAEGCAGVSGTRGASAGVPGCAVPGSGAARSPRRHPMRSTDRSSGGDRVRGGARDAPARFWHTPHPRRAAPRQIPPARAPTPHGPGQQ